MAKESKDKAREVKDLREDKTEREKALDDAIAAIHRAYGKGCYHEVGRIHDGSYDRSAAYRFA